MTNYQLIPVPDTGDTRLEIECDIEEDIEGALEDFVRLSHTFQFMKAQEFYDECLSTHEAWFPVSAEYADFLCLQRQYGQLKSFSLAAQTRFSNRQERALFRMMVLLADCYHQHGNIQYINNTFLKAIQIWEAADIPFPASSDVEKHILELSVQLVMMTFADTSAYTNLEYLVKIISYGQFSGRNGHLDFLKSRWDWLMHNEHFWEAQIIYDQLYSYDRSAEFLRRFGSRDSVLSDFFYRAEKSKTDVDSTQVALSALTQRILSRKVRAMSKVIDKSYSTFPVLSSGYNFTPWNDNVSCALFGTALVDIDKSPPSEAMRYYFSHCLEDYLEPTKLSLQSQPLLGDRAAALEAVINGDVNLVQFESGEIWPDVACVAFLKGAEIGNLTSLHIESAGRSSVYMTDLVQRSALHLASINRHCHTVQQLLRLGADPNAIDWFGCSPLHYASGCNESNQVSNLESIRLLCTSGADLNARTTPQGRTPLHIAARCGQAEAARKLLRHSASSKVLDNDGNTPFDLAIAHKSLGVVKVLIEYDASTDSLLRSGTTFLHIAAKYGFSVPQDLSLEDIPLIDSRDDMGNAPLHLASYGGNHELVSVLCKREANVDILTHKGQTSLHIAVECERENVVKALLEHGASVDISDSTGKTPLHIATRLGHENVMKALLEHDASTHISDFTGQTSWHIAIECKRENVVKALLAHGGSVDILDSNKETPLLYAARGGDAYVVRLLLEHDASVDIFGSDKKTPLHYAARDGDAHMARLLLEHGASVDIFDSDMETPLHYAVRNGDAHMVRLLLEHGASVDIFGSNKETPLHCAARSGHAHVVRLLLEHNASVDMRDDFQLTPLHMAAERGENHTAKLLIDMGASLESLGTDNDTPLHLAVRAGKYEMVTLLLSKGAAINSLNASHSTPLHHAVTNDDFNIAILLLQFGARTDVVNAEGQTPMHLAANNRRILDKLESYGFFNDWQSSYPQQALTTGPPTPTHSKKKK